MWSKRAQSLPAQREAEGARHGNQEGTGSPPQCPCPRMMGGGWGEVRTPVRAGLLTCSASALESGFPLGVHGVLPCGVSEQSCLRPPQRAGRGPGVVPLHYHSRGPKSKETRGWVQTHPSRLLTHVQGVCWDTHHTCDAHCVHKRQRKEIRHSSRTRARQTHLDA